MDGAKVVVMLAGSLIVAKNVGLDEVLWLVDVGRADEGVRLFKGSE